MLMRFSPAAVRIFSTNSLSSFSCAITPPYQHPRPPKPPPPTKGPLKPPPPPNPPPPHPPPLCPPYPRPPNKSHQNINRLSGVNNTTKITITSRRIPPTEIPIGGVGARACAPVSCTPASCAITFATREVSNNTAPL